MYRKGAFFSDKLLAMTLLNKNKNPNEISKQQMKIFMIRNLEATQHNKGSKANQSKRPQTCNKSGRSKALLMKDEPPVDSIEVERSRQFINNLYVNRPTKFGLQEFIPKLQDKMLKELDDDKDLSPTTKLRVIQRQLELERQTSNVPLTSNFNGIERPLPVFEGFKHDSNLSNHQGRASATSLLGLQSFDRERQQRMRHSSACAHRGLLNTSQINVHRKDGVQKAASQIEIHINDYVNDKVSNSAKGKAIAETQASSTKHSMMHLSSAALMSPNYATG